MNNPENNNYPHPTNIYELLANFRDTGAGFTLELLAQASNLKVKSIGAILELFLIQDTLCQGKDPNSGEPVFFLSEQALIPQVKPKIKPPDISHNPKTIIIRDLPDEYNLGKI